MDVVTDSARLDQEALNSRRIDPVDCPIDFMKAQHAVLRHIVAALSAIAKGETTTQASELYEILCAEVGQILQDRRANVFPVIRHRSGPDDEVDLLITTLESEYRAIEHEAEALARALDVATGRSTSRRSVRVPAERLILHLRQMVAVESSVLIPLLRVRLEKSDYELLIAAFRASRENALNSPVEAL